MAAPGFILQNPWALGDTVCMSALVRDIQRAYPGKYKIYATGHYLAHWKHNPHCEALDPPAIRALPAGSARIVQLDYQEGLKDSTNGKKFHFLSYFHKDFRRKTGIDVPVTEPKGAIYLSRNEQQQIYPFRYWVVIAGGKFDMTTKIWRTSYFQEVVDRVTKMGITCVQAGAKFARHYHPVLQNCVSAIGKTDSIRDLYRLIYYADGVICGITGAMHVAAAFDKPCVVIAGGREDPSWEAYTNSYQPLSFGPTCKPVKVEHKFLHTIGLIDCGIGNLKRGCWKDRTVPLERSDHMNERKRKQLCRKPLRLVGQTIPECMAMVTPDHVMEAVEWYYREGILPCLK